MEIGQIIETVLRRRENKKFAQHTLNELRRAKRIGDAMNLFDVLEREEITDSKIYCTGIRLAFEINEVQLAEKRYREANIRNQSDPLIHGTMIEEHIKRRNSGRGLEILAIAQSLGEDSSAHYSLILNSKKEGNFKETKRFFEEIPLDKRDKIIYAQTIRLFVRFHKIEEAGKILKEAIDRNMAEESIRSFLEEEAAKAGKIMRF
jgi:tetratricopeptide (TPR) repeat protein